MKPLLRLLCLFLAMLLSSVVQAGESVHGTIRYELDTSKPFRRSPVVEKHRQWKEAILPKLGGHRSVLFFARTDLPLVKDGKRITGTVYQCVERPHLFYVANSYSCLDFKNPHIGTASVGGISIHPYKGRAVLLCLNWTGGLGYAVQKITGKRATWKGNHDADWFKVD